MTEKVEKKRREYTEQQAMTRIENVLTRVQPAKARARVMRYLHDRFGDADVQDELGVDPRQASIPGVE